MERKHEKVLLEEIGRLVDDLTQARSQISRTIDVSKRSLAKLLPESDRRTLDIIMNILVRYYNTSEEQMAGDSKEGGVMRARRIFGSLGYNRTRASYAYVGSIIKRDHASVMNHCKKMANFRDTNDSLYDEYLEVEARLDETLNMLGYIGHKRRDRTDK